MQNKNNTGRKKRFLLYVAFEEADTAGQTTTVATRMLESPAKTVVLMFTQAAPLATPAGDGGAGVGADVVFPVLDALDALVLLAEPALEELATGFPFGLGAGVGDTVALVAFELLL